MGRHEAAGPGSWLDRTEPADPTTPPAGPDVPYVGLGTTPAGPGTPYVGPPGTPPAPGTRPGGPGREPGRTPPGSGAGGGDLDEPLPSFTEQVAAQVGGVRGMIEASIPVAIFVVVNIVWGLWPALYGSVGAGVGLAVYRLAQRRPIRHAVNGLFGIAIGAALVLRTGQARDFHLTTILWSLGYGMALLVSVTARWPLVGFIWSITFGSGSTAWRSIARLRRLFAWLTVLWAAVYLAKSFALFVLWRLDNVDALGVARLVLGYPAYAALLAVSVWAVRRVHPAAAAPLPAD